MWSVIVKTTAAERPVIGAIKRGVANEVILSLTKTINHREERAATEEHREAVELLTEAVVGILQAVQPIRRKTSKNNG